MWAELPSCTISATSQLKHTHIYSNFPSSYLNAPTQPKVQKFILDDITNTSICLHKQTHTNTYNYRTLQTPNHPITMFTTKVAPYDIPQNTARTRHLRQCYLTPKRKRKEKTLKLQTHTCSIMTSGIAGPTVTHATCQCF